MNKNILRLSLAAVFASWMPTTVHATPLKEVRLDYAYYSPSSLVLKDQGLLEKRLAEQNISVKWVQSLGSNRALEFLNSGSIDFASTAGLAAVLSRANGSPVKSIYVSSRPEWTALVVAKDSPIKSLADLKGKKVAATKGTDPFLFLLQSLNSAGLGKNDVEIVHLQHPDGRVALERGNVDAWAGLDPHMAASEVQAGSRLIYRNPGFNSYSVLNVSDDFLKQQPALIKEVIAAYEQAREWAIANPEALAQLLAKEANLPLEVAKLQLSRTDFSNSQPGSEHIAALKAAAPILLNEQLVRPGTDVAKVVDQLISPQLAASVIKQAVAKASN